MPKKFTPRPSVDPAEAHNKRILKERQDRIDAKKVKAATPVLDLLGVHVEQKPPANATEFLRDEFDKRNFGTPVMSTRVLYGPDPLLHIPLFKQRIEELGLEDFAAIVYETIMAKEEMAFPDPLLRKGIRQGIRNFGKEAIAQSFSDRILKIPSKIVNVEVDTGDDDEVLGHPLEDAVRRYCDPGMSPKFLSERCIALMGKRGYQIRIDEHGDPVRVGTLILGQIPESVARRRRQKYADESDQAIHDADNNYISAQERFLEGMAKDGPKGSHFLPAGETLQGNASDNDDPITMGLSIEEEPARA